MDRLFMISKYGFIFLFFGLFSQFASANSDSKPNVFNPKSCFKISYSLGENRSCKVRFSNNTGDARNCHGIKIWIRVRLVYNNRDSEFKFEPAVVERWKSLVAEPPKGQATDWVRCLGEVIKAEAIN